MSGNSEKVGQAVGAERDFQKGRTFTASFAYRCSLGVFLGLMVIPQATPADINPQSSGDHIGVYDASSFSTDSKMGIQARRAAIESYKRLNNERHKQLKQDSDRLIEMASLLRAEVDDGSRQKLSNKTVQRAAQIEKLAHQVQEKMKTVYAP